MLDIYKIAIVIAMTTLSDFITSHGMIIAVVVGAIILAGMLFLRHRLTNAVSASSAPEAPAAAPSATAPASPESGMHCDPATGLCPRHSAETTLDEQQIQNDQARVENALLEDQQNGYSQNTN